MQKERPIDRVDLRVSSDSILPERHLLWMKNYRLLSEWHSPTPRIREIEKQKLIKQNMDVEPSESAAEIIENIGFYKVHEARYELLRE